MQNEIMLYNAVNVFTERKKNTKFSCMTNLNIMGQGPPKLNT